MTLERDTAEQWSHNYRPLGIEGMVIQGAATRYLPGRSRSWLEREAEEVMVGAVTWTLERPEAMGAGRLTVDGNW